MKYVVFYGGPMAAGHNEQPGATSSEETMAKIGSTTRRTGSASTGSSRTDAS